jgi:hypothetical protein
MGMGASNVPARVAASHGAISEVGVNFQPCADIPCGGVLLAVPALLGAGLLRNTEQHFELPAGYYGMLSIFMLLGLMALARIKVMEDLRYCAPGEWGKLLGLDRIPEVRTLREKVQLLAGNPEAETWSLELCQEWMKEADNESSGVFYIDGHVQVYWGHQTELPRHYVARERLCLRATVDYWVNALNGAPFFLVTKEVDPGLLAVLRTEVVPRLLRDAPNQPTPEQLEKDPTLHRLCIVFDRAGYSPEFFAEMWAQRVACLSYHKYPGGDWPEDEFVEQTVTLVSGERVQMHLAERGVFLGKKLWVRELRKLGSNGHQTSIVATDYKTEIRSLAPKMFARWCQENFFRYMRQQFNLDRVITYKLQAMDETTRLVNPQYRELDGQVRKKLALLSRRLAVFGALSLPGDFSAEQMEQYERKKGALQEEITGLQNAVAKLKAERKATKHHITMAELPPERRFCRLDSQSKHFVDTIKMIAYRAETAMAHILREKMTRIDDARRLLQSLYKTEVDLLPNETQSTLTVRVHHQANYAADEAIKHLCEELTSTNTTFPGSNLRLIYELGSS